MQFCDQFEIVCETGVQYIHQTGQGRAEKFREAETEISKKGYFNENVEISRPPSSHRVARGLGGQLEVGYFQYYFHIFQREGSFYRYGNRAPFDVYMCVVGYRSILIYA